MRRTIYSDKRLLFRRPHTPDRPSGIAKIRGAERRTINSSARVHTPIEIAPQTSIVHHDIRYTSQMDGEFAGIYLPMRPSCMNWRWLGHSLPPRWM